MAETWPLGLPQSALIEGFAEQLPNVVVRTSMDMGPVKVRRRYTAAPASFRLMLSLTKDQLALFRTFFNDTLEGGALTFDWVHPVTQSAIELRFQAPPTIQAVSPDVFNVALALEEIV